MVLPGGKELPICQFKRVTDLPCPGCGLTRSFIGVAHLDLDRAARFHPFGLVLFPLAVVSALLLPLPAAARERLAGAAERHRRLLGALFWALLAAFLVHGFGRMLWVLVAPQNRIW
jgi:hypothetical protein